MQRPITQQFTPPAHPNWTGRSYRDSHEAFGAWWQPAPVKETSAWGWRIAVAVVILAVLLSIPA